MRRGVIIIIAIVALLAIVGGVLYLVGVLNPKSSGILVESIPDSTVFIDGEQVGRTPYEATLKSSEIILKLVPESFETPLAPYETKIVLAPGVKTVVKREFGESDDMSSGVVVSYDKESGGNASLAVVSEPDNAQVSVDGQVKGFTPHKSSSVVEGEHILGVAARGYKSLEVSVKALEDYKLTAVFKLAPDPDYEAEEKEEESEEEEEEDKKEVVIVKVKILPTGVGFLRVRSGPSTSEAEVAQVEPGETYVLIEQDEESGWYKIEYEEGEEGWVTDQYAEEVDGSDTESEEDASDDET